MSYHLGLKCKFVFDEMNNLILEVNLDKGQYIRSRLCYIFLDIKKMSPIITKKSNYMMTIINYDKYMKNKEKIDKHKDNLYILVDPYKKVLLMCSCALRPSDIVDDAIFLYGLTIDYMSKIASDNGFVVDDKVNEICSV